MQIKIKKDIIGRVGDDSVTLKEGDIIEVPDKDGEHLVAGGYAEVVAPDAVKVVVKKADKPKVK